MSTAKKKCRKNHVAPTPTFPLKLTKFELVHLRDVLSITSPPDLQRTLSQMLAEAEDRSLVEQKLWGKISAACEAAGVPMGDDAPDFVAAPMAPPPIGVFRMAHEPQDEEETQTGFLPKQEED
jgi:hypothetical protein